MSHKVAISEILTIDSKIVVPERKRNGEKNRLPLKNKDYYVMQH